MKGEEVRDLTDIEVKDLIHFGKDLSELLHSAGETVLMDIITIIYFVSIYYLQKHDLRLGMDYFAIRDTDVTLADLEIAYEEGWCAIINDGKLLGYRKEKPL